MYTFPHPYSNPFKLSLKAISQRSRKSSQWELFTFYLLIKQTLGILLQTPQRTVCLGCAGSRLTSGLRATASPGADGALSGEIHTSDHLPPVFFLLITRGKNFNPYWETGCTTSHCGFDLHFSEDWWCLSPLHASVGYFLYAFATVSVRMVIIKKANDNKC